MGRAEREGGADRRTERDRLEGLGTGDERNVREVLHPAVLDPGAAREGVGVELFGQMAGEGVDLHAERGDADERKDVAADELGRRAAHHVCERDVDAKNIAIAVTGEHRPHAKTMALVHCTVAMQHWVIWVGFGEKPQVVIRIDLVRARLVDERRCTLGVAEQPQVHVFGRACAREAQLERESALEQRGRRRDRDEACEEPLHHRERSQPVHRERSLACACP
jgi:hypothetical protein